MSEVPLYYARLEWPAVCCQPQFYRCAQTATNMCRPTTPADSGVSGAALSPASLHWTTLHFLGGRTKRGNESFREAGTGGAHLANKRQCPPRALYKDYALGLPVLPQGQTDDARHMVSTVDTTPFRKTGVTSHKGLYLEKV